MKTSHVILSIGATLLALGILSGALRGTRPVNRPIRFDLGSTISFSEGLDG